MENLRQPEKTHQMQLDRTHLKLNIKRKEDEAKGRVESRIFKAGKKIDKTHRQNI